MAIRLLIPATIAAVAFAAFLPALENGFVNWDDEQNFLQNPNYRGLGWQQITWMFTTFHLGHYQPLSWLTLGVDYSLWGLNPFGYHLTGLLLHAVGAVLFYFVCLRLLRLSFAAAETAALRRSAAFAALFFAIHPLRVESVAWITERRDVLSGIFLFASVLLYLRVAEKKSGRARLLVGSLLFYGLSLLSKASGMTLALVLVVLDVYPLRRLPSSPSEWLAHRYRAVWLEKVTFLIPGMVAGIVALTAQKQAGALVSVGAYGVGRRLGQAVYSAVFYIWKTIAPGYLSPLYQVPFQADSWFLVFTISGVALAAITVILFAMRKIAPGVFAAWLCYLALLAPVSGFAQSGIQFVADRYSYLPCLAWALLAGAGCYKLVFKIQRLHMVFACGSILLLVLGLATWRQAFIWHDSGTLWRHTVSVMPESSVANYNLGVAVEAEGDIEDAMADYRKAISLDEAYAEARYNLARLLARKGDIDEAISEYRRTAAIEPTDADTHNNLALLLMKRGKNDEARAELMRTIQIDPNHARAHYNLGKLLASEGRLDDATSHFQRAIAKEPNVAEIHEQLARALAQQGRKEDAMRHYEEAVRLMRR
ncbi:MAG TPA: tetratricopeptide repeat protein [Candidatus Binatia bacterium]